MGEYLARLNYGEMMGFLGLGGGLMLGLVAVVGGLWFEMRRTEIAAGLKHDMLDRGMSADEIKTVLEAGAGAHRARKVAAHSRTSCCS